jgi:hypothetical protein
LTCGGEDRDTKPASKIIDGATVYAGGIVLLLYSSTGHGGHGPLVVFASAVQRSARLAGERWGVCVLAPVWFLDASMKMLMVGWNAVHLLE